MADVDTTCLRLAEGRSALYSAARRAAYLCICVFNGRACVARRGKLCGDDIHVHARMLHMSGPFASGLRSSLLSAQVRCYCKRIPKPLHSQFLHHRQAEPTACWDDCSFVDSFYLLA